MPGLLDVTRFLSLDVTICYVVQLNTANSRQHLNFGLIVLLSSVNKLFVCNISSKSTFVQNQNLDIELLNKQESDI